MANPYFTHDVNSNNAHQFQPPAQNQQTPLQQTNSAGGGGAAAAVSDVAAMLGLPPAPPLVAPNQHQLQQQQQQRNDLFCAGNDRGGGGGGHDATGGVPAPHQRSPHAHVAPRPQQLTNPYGQRVNQQQPAPNPVAPSPPLQLQPNAAHVKPQTALTSEQHVVLRVATCNVLFESFYVKYTKTQTTFPAAQRAASFERAMQMPPLADADVIMFQEFAHPQIDVVRSAGFEVMLVDSAAGHARTRTAYVATAFRRSAFYFPAHDSEAVPLEDSPSSKTLLVHSMVHAHTGQIISFGNAHVPWSSNEQNFHRYFSMMKAIMRSVPASIFCGDFNAEHRVFAAAKQVACEKDDGAAADGGGIVENMSFPGFVSATAVYEASAAAASSKADSEQNTDDKERKLVASANSAPQDGAKKNGNDDNDDDEPAAVAIKNAVANAPHTALSPNNHAHSIDHCWFTNRGGFLVRRPGADPIVVPENADDFVRHGSKPGAADYSWYFSDHAIVVADFEVRRLPGWPTSRGNLHSVVSDAESKCLNRAQPQSRNMQPY